MIKLGDEVKCQLTGIKGIVVAYTIWLYGCARIGIQPRGVENGVAVEPHWIDEMQATVLKAGKFKAAYEDAHRDTGGPRDDAAGSPGRHDPRR